MEEIFRTIEFDLTNEFEIELLTYLESKGEKNISSYVKQLILDDINGKFHDVSTKS